MFRWFQVKSGDGLLLLPTCKQPTHGTNQETEGEGFGGQCIELPWPSLTVR